MTRAADPQRARPTRPVARVLDEPGRPLDGAVRSVMERRLGHDFSDVRVHAGPVAAAAAGALDARAFAVGEHVVLGPSWDGADGHATLAHELSHVERPASTLAKWVGGDRHLGLCWSHCRIAGMWG